MYISRSLLCALLLASCAHKTPVVVEKEKAPMRVNPFFAPSALQYQAPDFTQIKDEDFKPAMLEGMKQHLAEVEAIAKQSDAPTFENTIVALERAGALLSRTSKVFYGLVGANTNDTLQQVETEMAPLLSAHYDSIYLNKTLFERIRTLHNARTTSALTAEQQFLLHRYYLNFVRSGAELAETDKEKLRALNQEESTLSTEFSNKLLAATKAGALVVDDKAMLDGLSEGDIAAAAAAANDRGLAGKWVITLQNTTQHPMQPMINNRAIREKLFLASTKRTEQGDANDTRAIVERLAILRAEKAKLLGFATYADYSLADQMAKTPENAIKLLSGLVPAATAKARDELKMMQALADKQKAGFALAPWDWQYYSEQVRKAEYDLDESQLKPYFEANSVVENGIFYAANQLYGITFKPRTDLPVYHPDVRAYEVFDADGTSLAIYYIDLFARDNKNGGAWESSFVDQSGLRGTKPVVYNVCNFKKPAAGEPALISFDDVNTLFHEFGHALHDMFSKVEYPTLAGTNVPRDFVEFPSQINEHWALDPKVLANYAKHYKTGEVMPQALVDKIKKAGTFNQGFATTEYLQASLLDLAWHAIPAGSAVQKVDDFEPAKLKSFEIPQVPPRYRTSYFAHIWGGGYSAGYYAYLWSELIEADAYAWFTENGGLKRENGQIFREKILSKGGTLDAAEMYRAFRGKDPSIEPLLKQRGFDAKPEPAKPEPAKKPEEKGKGKGKNK